MHAKVRMEKRTNLLKARLLFPFAKRYRDRVRLADESESFKIIASDIITTNDRKLVFVKNAKAGCTTVAHALFYYNYGTNYDGWIHGRHARLAQGNRFAFENVAALRDTSMYKFTFVRNPTRRILSMFSNFVLDRTNRSAKHHIDPMSHFGYNSENTSHDNFDAFLDYISHSFSISKQYTDKHFRPQIINTAYDSLNYNHIGRLENYQADLRYILQDAGVWRDELSEIINIRANASKSAHYTPSAQQLQRIGALYYDDYVAFDYPLPLNDTPPE